MRRSGALVLLLLVTVQTAAAEYRLIGRTSRSNNLGTSLARWGDRLAIGGGNFRNNRQRQVARTVDAATNGRPRLFQRPTTEPPLLGTSVAVAGAGLVVGVSGADTNGTDLGRAYLFSPTGVLLRTFPDPAPGMSEFFGLAVAASENTVAVADPWERVDGSLLGSVAVFDAGVDSSLGALVFTLHSPEPHSLDRFGTAVAVGADRIFVGVPGDGTAGASAGAVHVFDRTTGAFLGRIVSPSPRVGGMFGSALTLAAGDDLIVAGEVVGVSALVNEGRVHRFAKDGAWRWTAVTGDPVGSVLPSVAVGEAGVVVGSPGVAGSVAGAYAGEVELYDSVTGALLETIANPSYRAPAFEGFGAAVATIGPYVIAVDRYDAAPDGTNRAIYWFADDSRCGDGTVDPGEACDDGNRVSGDGCDANCQPTGCGNGEVTAGEACDVGDDDDSDFCDARCQVPRCGDGRVTSPEECDDGNGVDGDGCDHNCTETRCGNGVVTAPERCDTGPDFPPDLGCLDNCLPPGVTTTSTTVTVTTTTRPITTTTRTTTTATGTSATTATVPSTTSTTLVVPSCVDTRQPGLRCVQEGLAEVQIDCAGELVTPQIGRIIDQLQGLVVDLDQAATAGRRKRAVTRTGRLLGKMRKAVDRAQANGGIGIRCADRLRGLVSGVETGVRTAGQGGRP